MTGAATEPMNDGAVHPGRWRTLWVLCLSLMIVMIANASLNVAIPALARDLGASASSLQWMVDAYALVFAGLLFTAGALGDRYGRKGALQAGLVLFLVASAMAALADSSAAVIVARAVMGAAAALVMPSTLSILTNIFPAHERGRAISLWAAIAAGGAAAGPITSGLLLEHFWWGSVFLVNVPLVAAALVGGRLVPTSRDPEGHPLDPPGALWSVVGVGALVFAIIEAPRHGWTSATTLATFAVAALALGAFARRELRARHPMLDLRLFGDRRFSASSAGIALTFFAMFGTFFLVTQYVQLVLGYSPLQASLVILPMSFGIMVLAPRVPPLVERVGAAPVVAGGLGLFALGMAILSTLQADSSIWLVGLSFVPMAAGMAMTGPPLTTLLMSSVPTGRAGIGSAMNDTSRELGGALGVAVLGSLVATAFSSSIEPSVAGLPDRSQALAATGLAGALEVAGELPGPAGEAVADAARMAFVDGFGVATLAAAAVLLLGSVAALVLLPRRATAGADIPGGTGRTSGKLSRTDQAGAAMSWAGPSRLNGREADRPHRLQGSAMTTQTALAIEATGLVKSYGQTRAVDGVDLAVRRGSVYGVLGPNGAGKTTTIRMLATLVRPDAGRAQVLGHDIVEEADAVRASVSLTGQLASVDEDLTGRENLILLGRLLGLKRAAAKARAGELLAAFGLSEAAGRLVKHYSGGMRRRLDIAASMVVTPELMFLDEPTTGLDPRSRNQVWDIIRALVAEGTTVLLCTQYLEEADQLADGIAVIDRGRVIAEGTPGQLKASVGSGSLRVRLLDPAQRPEAHHVLDRQLGVVTFEPDPAALSVACANGDRAAEAVAELARSGVRIADFSLGQPSLDEVFLALTGHPADDVPADEVPDDRPDAIAEEQPA